MDTRNARERDTYKIPKGKIKVFFFVQPNGFSINLKKEKKKTATKNLKIKLIVPSFLHE